MAKILVVEDDESLRRMIDCFFEAWGVERVYVIDADEAYEAWQPLRDQIRVIVSDTHAPRQFSGVRFLEKVREVDNETPFFLMSGSASNFSDEFQRKCFDLGMTDFLPKPLDFDHVHKIVLTTLCGKKEKCCW